MNRYTLESMKEGLAQSLRQESENLQKMYIDTTSTIDIRKEQAEKVKDLEERMDGILKQIQEEDARQAMKFGKNETPGDPEKAIVAAKAAFYRSVIKMETLDAEKAALLDTDESGGNKLLPKTVSDQVVTAPTVTNPLRELSTITNITNLEIPRLSFSLNDDSFTPDGETAKEMKSTPGIISFTRNKFKVFAPVSETVLNGSDANLVNLVENALLSGLAKKEKTVALQTAPSESEKHMSFYSKNGNAYEITAVTGANLYKAIKAAIADLEEDYRERSTVLMRYADYLDIIETLANGSAVLYNAQPEQVLGKPVKFCDLAVIPIVGDFSYSHYNYDLNMTMEHDKDIKTGIENFALTAYIDHRIKIKSAFRLAVVGSATPTNEAVQKTVMEAPAPKEKAGK